MPPRPGSLGDLSTAFQSSPRSCGSAGWPGVDRGVSCSPRLSLHLQPPVRPVLEPPEGRVRGGGTGSLGLLWEPTLRGAAPHSPEADGIPADVSEPGPTPRSECRKGPSLSPELLGAPMGRPQLGRCTWAASALRGLRGGVEQPARAAHVLIDSFGMLKTLSCWKFGASAASPTRVYL